MRRRWTESAFFLLVAQSSISHVLATPFSNFQSLDLLPRQQAATCGGKAGLSTCGSNFPSEFCCPTSTTCVPLNSTQAVAVICCPKGADCGRIQTVPCDVNQYNATLHPDNQIHIDNTTNIKLPTCGDKCCPLGYSCNGNTCIADKAAPSTGATPSATPSPSSTDKPAASQTSDSTPISAIPQTPAGNSDPGFPAKAVVAGFFPGMALGALLTLLLLWAIKKRKESLEKNRYSGDFGHVSRSISDPIYDPVYAARTDFIRRGSVSAHPSPANSRTGMVQRSNTQTSHVGGGGFLGSPRVRSLFSKSPKIGTAMPFPAPTINRPDRDPYRTPTRSPTTRRKSLKNKNAYKAGGIGKRLDVARSGSTETIDVLMPAPSFLQVPVGLGMQNGDGKRLTTDSSMTQATTFTKLMERAGFEGEERRDVREGSQQGRWKGGPFMREK